MRELSSLSRLTDDPGPGHTAPAGQQHVRRPVPPTPDPKGKKKRGLFGR